MVDEELIAKCYRLRDHLENDPMELRPGLQGDIWEEYRVLVQKETDTLSSVISKLVKLS